MRKRGDAVCVNRNAIIAAAGATESGASAGRLSVVCTSVVEVTAGCDVLGAE